MIILGGSAWETSLGLTWFTMILASLTGEESRTLPACEGSSKAALSQELRLTVS